MTAGADRLRLAFLANPSALAARQWMAFFADRGHDVSLIIRSSIDVPDGLHERIRIHRMAPIRGRVFGRLSFIDARSAIRRVLNDVRPDVLHVHDMTTGYGWIARLSGFSPYVITTWGSDIYLEVGKTAGSRLLGRLALAGSSLVTMESRHLRSAAIRAGARADRTRILQFGVDTTKYQPGTAEALRTRLELHGRRVIFSPRQIAPLYKHETVLRAASRLTDDVVVLMSELDAKPDYLAGLRVLARDLGIAHRVRTVPAIAHDEMVDFYRLADVVVSVPGSDAVSICILESLACAKPVVASDLPSPREWVDEIWPDLVVPVGDVEGLTDALHRALSLSASDLSRRTALGRELVSARAERTTNLVTAEGYYRSLARDGRL